MTSNKAPVRAKSRKNLLTFSTALAGAAAVAAVFAPGVASAQDDDEAIVVTGTRIARPNLYTTSPVTQVTAQDITLQGVTRIEDLTNQLPQVFAAQGSTYSNGATGTAQVNLRGLGAVRTLVLVDGRRMPYGSPNSAAADLNQIPGQLVERVEVLTGGASAVYGSDAVAGVVNFIMRDDYEGFRVDAQYGFYQHNNDYDGPGNIRGVIQARGEANPSQFQLPDQEVIDGYGKEISVVFGASSPDGRGNITSYATFRSNDQILQRDRDYSACALGNPTAAGEWTCGGSGTSFPGQFTDFGGLGPFNTRALTDPSQDPGSGNPVVPGTSICEQITGVYPCTAAYTVTGDEFRAYTGNDVYNFGPVNYYQRPDTRYSLGAFARYSISDRVEAYSQVMYTDYRSTSQIAPSGNFFVTGSINCDNPMLSQQQVDLLCNGFLLDASGNVVGPVDGSYVSPDPDGPGLGQASSPNRVVVDTDPNTPGNQGTTPYYIGRRNVEGGGRRDDLKYESFRMVGGLRGDLTDTWSYDLSAQYSQVNLARTYRNDFSITRVTRALDVVADPDSGDPVCRSVLDGTDPACVPYNIFSLGNVTPEALNYVQIPLIQTGTTVQQVVTGAVTGDLGFTSPMAENGLAVAFGFEYRRDSLETDTDVAFQTGDGAGQGGPTLPLSGTTDVLDFFGEANLPLVEGAALADLISLDLSYRYSDYSTGVTSDSYGIGLDWAPTQDLRFRGSFQRAVRAANVLELFLGQGFGLFDLDDDPCDLNDPADDGVGQTAICQGTNPWQVTAAQAAAGGLDSPAGQYNGLFGGNPDLEPEQADTTTIGFVATPSFLPGFNISVDYFDIEITNLVSTTGATNTLNDCYNNGNLDSCQRILRNPGTGQLWVGAGRVEDLNTNIGGLATSGYDINAGYTMDIGESALTFELIGTYLQDLIIDPGAATGITPYDCVGGFGQALTCAASGSPPNPEWRHRFRVGWETPWDVNLYATWRHYGEVELRNAANQPLPGRPDSVFDAENYLDLSGNWSVSETARLRFGVNNVLDNDPPISAQVGAGAGNGNTYPQVYDAAGRWVFAGVTLDF